MMVAEGVDFLCLAPHSDDAEIGLGGTLRLLADQGRAVWVCDLTRGELGSNGTPDERWQEAIAAARALGLAGRLQLSLPDGFITPQDPQQVAAVVHVIRRLRPRWLASAPAPARHPDHLATPALVRRAAFLSGLAAYLPAAPASRAWPAPPPAEGADHPWRSEALLEVCPPGQPPAMIFDVTAVWPAKAAALACYASQFAAGPGRRPTLINDAAFLADIEHTARRWGFQAGCELGEALRTDAVPVLRDLPPLRWA